MKANKLVYKFKQSNIKEVCPKNALGFVGIDLEALKENIHILDSK